MTGRFIRHWALGATLALCVALFVCSAYLIPDLWGPRALALAYTIRYLFVIATTLAFGGSTSPLVFVLKAAGAVVVFGFLVALLGRLLPGRRRKADAGSI